MTSRARQSLSLRPLLPPHVKSATPPSLTESSPRPPQATPFFRDPGHTIPTKWSLYRPLLRSTFSSDLLSTRREIRTRWRETQGLVSVPRVRSFIAEYHDLLTYLNSDDISHKEEIRLLEDKLKAKHDKLDLDLETAQEAKQLQEEERRARKSKMTGSFHRPTLFNPPLPRLKPQPTSIGSMIHNRLRARERRMERRRLYAGLLTDMKLEVGFWKSINPLESGDDWSKSKDPRSPGGWDGIIKNELKVMDDRFRNENTRAEMVFDEGLSERISRAKEKKGSWWKGVKEREKAQKGEGT
ncbi:hypothetical protein L486_07120 [Kwoniella mangroviensis CBS 10435]|uniref:Uncharacterized protein n=1 Tax=Kwoniella mangroviensis CBS 10435 TaxID=1331196 RepID=A0A1B9IJB1_9TREE|nr:hypothetical protein L486_07120 [Kwoniella mangroviensis CBS 10435]